MHLDNQKLRGECGGLDVDALQVGLTCDRDTLYKRINYRCELMLESGLENEVKWLLEKGYGPELKSMGSIGYRHMAGYLANEYDEAEMVRLLSRDTRRYAKRQYTWFNKNESIRWVEVTEQALVTEMVRNWRQPVNG
jgi:tRNA dimethylallyltransferase